MDQHPEIYKELRCGLTHEFIPKSRKFCIIKVGKVGIDCNNNDKDKIIDKIFNEVNFNILNPFDSSTVDCGVIFSQSVQGEMWLIFPLKLAIDFGKNIEKLINEIRQDNNKELIKNFFETAMQINLENFN